MDRIARILEAATENAERGLERTANALLETEQQLRALEERKKRLQYEKEQYELELKLRSSAGRWKRRRGSLTRRIWQKLSDGNKWKKENVLFMFIHSTWSALPDELCEGHFPIAARPRACWYNTAPESIRDDRDILLVRLAHKHFTIHYNGYALRVPFFRIPEQYVADKEVVLAVVDRYPAVLNQDVLPRHLLDDKDVFRAFIRSPWAHPRAHSYFITDYLQKFSAGIRANANLMVEAAANQISGHIFQHVDGELSKDKSFAVRLVEAVKPGPYCENVPSNALERFAERVRSDPDVVYLYVRRNGLCLKDAAKFLRRNEDFVRAACANKPDAIFYCTPGATLRRLGSDRAFMLEVFGRPPFLERRDDPKLYRMLSDDLKFDREIIAAAKKSGSLSLSDLPPSLAADRFFWIDMIAQDSTFWYGLPVFFMNEPVFVHAIEEFEMGTMVEAVFERFPFLSQDRNFWLKIIASDCQYFLPDVIRKCAPQQIRHDRELMLYACKRNPTRVFELLPLLLQQDREVVEVVVERMEEAGSLLSFWDMEIPFDVQRLFPDLVAKAIALSAKNGNDLHDNERVAPELWSNLEVCKAWFSCDESFVPSRLPESMKDNQELGLVIAKGFNDSNDVFRGATSDALRSNKSFMMKAVQSKSARFLAAHGSLRHDFELAVTAFGCADYGESNASEYLEDDRDFSFFRRFLKEVEEKVNAHEGLVAGLLCGMTDSAGSDCLLPMLANDAETSLALKQTIAAFLGVSVGTELRILRQALKNMDAAMREHYDYT